jgi:hypothetical protein
VNPSDLPADVAVTADELAHVQALGREPRRAWMHARYDALQAAGRHITQAVRDCGIANTDALAEAEERRGPTVPAEPRRRRR